MDKKQLIEALESSRKRPSSGDLNWAFNNGIREAVDIVKAQPEPTGMVVPLDALDLEIDAMIEQIAYGADPTFPRLFQDIRKASRALAIPAGITLDDHTREAFYSERIAELEAARTSYANLFGCEVGDIHQSIRELKAENAKLREDSEMLDWLMQKWPIKLTRDAIRETLRDET